MRPIRTRRKSRMRPARVTLPTLHKRGYRPKPGERAGPFLSAGLKKRDRKPERHRAFDKALKANSRKQPGYLPDSLERREVESGDRNYRLNALKNMEETIDTWVERDSDGYGRVLHPGEMHFLKYSKAPTLRAYVRGDNTRLKLRMKASIDKMKSERTKKPARSKK